MVIDQNVEKGLELILFEIINDVFKNKLKSQFTKDQDTLI